MKNKSYKPMNKDIYIKGDLVLVDDDKSFREVVVILSCNVPGDDAPHEFYEVFSIKEGSVYIVPRSLIKSRVVM